MAGKDRCSMTRLFGYLPFPTLAWRPTVFHPHRAAGAAVAAAEYYVHGSGVIAVVMYGLYGASSFIYGLSAKGTRQGSFFKFWDVASFITNGMVFFFVGVSITNFFLRWVGPHWAAYWEHVFCWLAGWLAAADFSVTVS